MKTNKKHMKFVVAFLLIIISNNLWAFKDCDKCPEMVVVPAGEFMMGSEVVPIAYADVFENEKPQHKVRIKSFAIGKHEVTQMQWRWVMGKNPSNFKGNSLPVEMVSWVDVQLYAQKLSEITGKKYRLPTEAEWEYAARAGSTSIYPWGDNELELPDYAWFSPKLNKTRPVGLKMANAFGLYDMIGNVEEWVLDCEHKNYLGAPSDGSAWTRNGDCSVRMLRGGYWDDPTLNARTATRNPQNKIVKSPFIGFRIVRDF